MLRIQPFSPVQPGRIAGSLFGLFAGLLVLSGGIAHADELCFYNGSTLHGKLSRVTGEIIEFREGGHFGRKHSLKRLQLGGRRDVIDTLDGQHYAGEIVYMDKFKIDIRTENGLIKLGRLPIRNIRLGVAAPSATTSNDVQPSDDDPIHPVSSQAPVPNGEQPATDTSGQDKPNADTDDDSDFP